MLYSSINAYTPLQRSRIFDADVIFASVDNIVKTKPRTRLFHPRGFDVEKWLFSQDQADLPFLILNDIYDALGEDQRLKMLYSASDVVNDYEAHTIALNLRIQIKGYDDRTFQRQLTITRVPGP